MARTDSHTDAATAAAPSLRDATMADVSSLMAIELECFDAPVAFGRRRIRDLVQNPRAIAPVVVCGGRIVAWGIGLIRPHRKHRSGRIYNLAVSVAARGRGLGMLLVGHLVDRLTERGATRIYLEVESGNAAAIALYRSAGFTPARELPDYFGPGRPGLSMCRDVGQGKVAEPEEA